MKFCRKHIAFLLALLLSGGMASAQVRVKGNIYGGCELGKVTQNTTVLLNDGTTEGSVYGGGRGVATDKQAGWIKGNTTVVMINGTVERSIYGGGEIGSVGTFNDSTLVTYTEGQNAGKTVYVPTSCASGTGLTTVRVTGGFVGRNGSTMPTLTSNPDDDDRGWIFCGSKGVADSITYYQAIAEGVVGSTYLEISNTTTPVITASVYGGCENGLVLTDTYVKIAGGQIGTGYQGNDTWDGIYTDQQWNTAISAINAGNLTATQTAPFHGCDAWPFGDGHGNYYVYDYYATANGNYPNGNSSGGGCNLGYNGHSFFGNVFGGGSGYYPFKAGVWRYTAGQVNGNTHVEITGGHILTNVYGGNEMTNVKGKCTVDMKGGTIGIPRTVADIEACPTNGYIFGAGMGDPRTAFNTWTNVRETEVNVTGGIIFSSVYGGGEEGHVITDTKVTVNELDHTNNPLVIGSQGITDFDGNVFGSGRGLQRLALTAGTIGGNTRVDIKKGTILGNVYGGGSMASVGTYLVRDHDPNYGKMQPDVTDPDHPENNELHGHVVVNITGGTIGTGNGTSSSGNVYGASKGSAYVLGSTTANTVWPDLAKVKQTSITINEEDGITLIKGNVYGGGELGTVTDNTVVSISAGTLNHDVFGGGYGSDDRTVTQGIAYTPAQYAGCVLGNTQVNILTDAAIKGNVYGGGEMASVGKVENNTLLNGITNVVVTGGTIGLDTINLNANNSPYYSPSGFVSPAAADGGNVFGGSKGMNSDPNGDFNAYGNVNYTRVTIGDSGKVWGSVYGGSENGHVLGNDSVFITSDDLNYPIGTQGTSGWDGNVFGGGKGNNTNAIAGLVCGNTYVCMDNGKVLGNIYGGGRLSIVGTNLTGAMQDGTDHGYTKVLVNGGIVGNNTKTGSNDNDPQVIEVFSTFSMGSVYGGGKGNINGLEGHHKASALLVGMVKNTEVIISDTLNNNTHIYGIVFGGGEVANVGKYSWEDNQTYGAQNIQVTEGKAKIHIKGGTIGGDRARMRFEAGDAPYNMYPKYNDDLGYVYGGGEGISDDPNNYELIMEGTTTATLTSLVDLMATVYETEVTISGGFVKGSVFGGAEAGHVRTNTLVTIKGGQIGAGDNGTTDVQPYADNQFINPVTTPITSSNALHGTTHWPFGVTQGTTTVYNPYDPVNVMMTGTEPSDGKSWFGNVFGGGSGWFPYIKEVSPGQYESHWNPLSGKVWGDTHVVIDGGHVLNNVYGGNEATDIGGKAIVEIKSGTVGVPRTKEQIIAQPCSGYVFGGGCGDPRTVFNTLNNVDSTRVVVSGGIIYGSVLGGAEDGHVLGNTKVIVSQKTSVPTVVGCNGLSTADGNIFGGGRNFLGENDCAGRVQGNINVTMTGGTILGSIFGGGRLALTGVDQQGNFIDANHGNVTINVSGTTSGSDDNLTYSTVIGNSNGRDLLCGSDESVGDIFGSGKGDTKNYENIAAGRVTNTIVNVTGSPRIYGSVFGGGEMASIGYWHEVNGKSVYYPNTGSAQVTIGSSGANASDSDHLLIGTEMEFRADYANDDPSYWTVYNSEGKLIHTCTGNVYGGAQGDVDTLECHWASMARSRTSEVIVNNGTIMSRVFGGAEQGSLAGNAHVTINGGHIGSWVNKDDDDDDNDYIFGGVYGGGYGSHNPIFNGTHMQSGPAIVNDSTNYINNNLWTADHLAGRVYGNAQVDLVGGEVKGDVFGGAEYAYLGVNGSTTHGKTTVNIGANTNGTYSGTATIQGSVFGANNYGGTPLGTVTVNGYGSTHVANVLGGGNLADYVGTTDVNIYGGNYSNIFGGGNSANVGDADVTVSGGTITTGVYGGCNTSHSVTGNVVVNITGGTFGAAAVGTQGQPGYVAEQLANIHGGGYGELTTVAGNITVNYGACANTSTAHSTDPLLYGAVYGGAGYGEVNTDANNTTRVNILNGTIHGSVFGGGLGQKAVGSQTAINAEVNGKIYVKIGDVLPTRDDEPTYIGEADLRDCIVYGCNNMQGSPMDDVFIDVYKTAHTTTDVYDYSGTDATYAINRMFGGGNEADYTPVGMKATTYIHGCENTIENLYGGSNAASAPGVVCTIDGGRFNNVFGGGNGTVNPANIGTGGINLTLHGGIVNYYYGGSDHLGTISGPTNLLVDNNGPCGQTIGTEIEEFFCGGNEAPSHSITTTIDCGSNLSNVLIKNLYGGCNKAPVTGDVTLTIKGGTYYNIFGGSKGVSGSEQDAEIGGNVTLNILGGKVGDAQKGIPGYIFGGNNHGGRIHGQITVNIDNECNTCGLDLSYATVYGGNNEAYYVPTINTVVNSPEVNLKNGTVLNVFGGSQGLGTKTTDNGFIKCNPVVNIGDGIATHSAIVLNSVYGGGETADVEGNTTVNIVSGNVQVGNDVFGGGHNAVVTGSTNVNVGGVFGVYAMANDGGTVMGGGCFQQGTNCTLIAAASDGYHFVNWTLNGSPVSTNATYNITVTGNATYVANFAANTEP